jgi:hypothetical protein
VQRKIFAIDKHLNHIFDGKLTFEKKTVVIFLCHNFEDGV